MKIRDLYSCYNARYPTTPASYVTCSKGHRLGQGNVRKEQVDNDARLVFKACQLCKDYEPMDSDLTPPEK